MKQNTIKTLKKKSKKKGFWPMIKKVDAVMTEYKRAKNEYRCERCNNQFDPTEKYGLSGLHNSHYMGRKCMATRFEIDNTECLCNGCHTYFEERKQTEYKDWKVARLGLERVEEIEAMSRPLKQWKIWELEELISEFRNKTLKMLGERR